MSNDPPGGAAPEAPWLEVTGSAHLADWLDPTILAIEDAMNEGVYDRPVQLVVADARGLPRENYLKCRKGYEWLVDQGCVVVLGPMISDNCLQLQNLINERHCSSIGWTGRACMTSCASCWVESG